jgi:hypothetical protein
MIVDDFCGERVETEELELSTLIAIRKDYFTYVVNVGPRGCHGGKAEYEHLIDCLEDIEEQIGWIVSQLT